MPEMKIDLIRENLNKLKKKSQSRNFWGFSGVFFENFKGFC